VSVQIDKGAADLDSNAVAWLENYKNALAKIKEWQEVADVARSHIEKTLGESEVGIYQNRPVVRWSFVETHRFDVKRAKGNIASAVIRYFADCFNISAIRLSGVR
jgi:hypothetical protein